VTLFNNIVEEEKVTKKTHQSRWVTWVNVLLKEMDTNFLLFNVNDVFRLADSLVDKIKAIVVMNWNQKSIKLLVQSLYTLVEDEPGNISI